MTNSGLTQGHIEVMEFSDLCADTFSTSAQNEKLLAWKFQTTDYDWLYKKVSFTVSIWPQVISLFQMFKIGCCMYDFWCCLYVYLFVYDELFSNKYDELDLFDRFEY